MYRKCIGCMRWWTYPQVMAASAVSMPHGSWAGEHERKSLIYCVPVAELLRAHATKLRRIFTWAAKVTGKTHTSDARAFV